MNNKPNFTDLRTLAFFQDHIGRFKSRITSIENRLKQIHETYHKDIEEIKVNEVKKKLTWNPPK